MEQISNLPKVEEINCWKNQLLVLESFPNIKILNCSNNNIVALDKMPNLMHLSCYDNRLTYINDYPNLIYLNCHSNFIKEIGYLPIITKLDCHENLLTELPILSNTLLELDCSSNQLSSLENIITCNKLLKIMFEHNEIKEMSQKVSYVITNIMIFNGNYNNKYNPNSSFNSEDECVIESSFKRIKLQ